MKPRTDKDKIGPMQIYSEIPRVVFEPKDIKVKESDNLDLGFILTCFSPYGDGEQTKQDVITGLKLLNDLRDLDSQHKGTMTPITLRDILNITGKYYDQINQ